MQITESNAVRNVKEWVLGLHPRFYGLIVGLLIGVIGGSVGLLLVTTGPTIMIGVLGGVLAGLFILMDVRLALYGLIAVVLMLPFGTFPIEIGITPTLIDLELVAFVGVYILQWATGKRHNLQFAPVHIGVLLYTMWLIFGFFMGMRYGSPQPNIIRQFAETLLSISLAFILVDLLRDPQTLRRLVLVVMLFVGLQAALAIFLYALPDGLAERLLVRLSRIGYPNGGVIRYIESNPALGERAIGTWVDPNTLGGMLSIAAAMIAPQVFAQKPVLKYRWVAFIVLCVVGFALLLSSSRGSFLALASGLVVIAFIRYHRFIPILGVAGVLMLFLPQTQQYLYRIVQAFRSEDLATQMRIGEWTDALNLIQQYPIFGIGFTGTPTNDVYTDVANMYLMMANQIGITGVLIFLLAMGGIFAYGYRAWRYARYDEELDSIHLGYHVALMVALVNAITDLYYFRLDFQASITWFWLIVALAIASSRLVLERARQDESTLDETSKIV
jgi:polysaccharide biosynthesis protein PslJ